MPRGVHTEAQARTCPMMVVFLQWGETYGMGMLYGYLYRQR